MYGLSIAAKQYTPKTVGQNFGNRLASGFSLSLSWNCSQDFSWHSVIWRHYWDWLEVLLPKWFTCKADKLDWFLVWNLTSYPCRSLHVTAWVSSQHGSRIPPEWEVQETKAEAGMLFISDITPFHLHGALLVTETSPESAWEESTYKHEY